MSSLYIFDLDNTLSDAAHRSYLAQCKDWESFHSRAMEDKPVTGIVQIYKELESAGNRMIILTGRPSNYAEQTNAWLNRHGIECEVLLMRPVGNYKQDYVYKTEAIAALLVGLNAQPADVVAIFEDRDTCVKALRDAGYCVLQVREGLY